MDIASYQTHPEYLLKGSWVMFELWHCRPPNKGMFTKEVFHRFETYRADKESSTATTISTDGWATSVARTEASTEEAIGTTAAGFPGSSSIGSSRAQIGTILVGFIPARVLVDSDASYYFMLSTFII